LGRIDGAGIPAGSRKMVRRQTRLNALNGGMTLRLQQKSKRASPMAAECPRRVAAVELVPVAIKVLSYEAELDDQGKVRRSLLATLFSRKAQQSFLVLSHDDTSIGAADEFTSVTC
jgi:hypothetical protein